MATWRIDREHPDFVEWATEHDLIPDLMSPVVVEKNGRVLIDRFRFSDDFGARQPFHLTATRPIPETCRSKA